MINYTKEEATIIVNRMVDEAVKETGLPRLSAHIKLVMDEIDKLFLEFLIARTSQEDLFSDFLKEQGL